MDITMDINNYGYNHGYVTTMDTLQSTMNIMASMIIM